MAALGKYLRTLEGGLLAFWCPGCDESHQIKVQLPNAWHYNGNPDAPTFTPSVLVTGIQWATGEYFHRPTHKVEAGQKTVCHTFVRDGRIEFLNDCTHHLVGQTVPMAEWPGEG